MFATHHPWLSLLLALALALAGCPDPGPADDDDDAEDDDVGDDDGGDDDGGDDDVGDDDGGDDDVGDDDVGDDDVGDDDTAGADIWGKAWNSEPNGYLLEQDLSGPPAANPCPTCDFSYDVQYTTNTSSGTCTVCAAFPDGVYTLAYDSDYQGQYPVILLGYQNNWYFWYTAYPGQGGHLLEFAYNGKGYSQYGYWDVGVITDADGDGYDSTVDCDDNDPAVNPGATEVCNGVDDNCDAVIDEGFDADGDGVTSCGGDCDDNDATTYPGALDVCDGGVDNDCDPATDENADNDGDGQSMCDGDCDDTDDQVYAGAVEACDGIDNDCDGIVPMDEIDSDGDGTLVCGGDCDDADPTVYPGATEVCDGLDQDCDGVADNNCVADMWGMAWNAETNGYLQEQFMMGWNSQTPCPTCDYTFDIDYTTTSLQGTCTECWALPDGVHTMAYDSDYYYGQYQVILLGYQNNWYYWYMAYPGQGGHYLEFNYAGTGYDQYGYWEIGSPADNDGDGFSPPLDCDDNDPAVNPGALEICDGVDNDCDPVTDENADADGDGQSVCGGDCDDTDAAVYDGAAEACDGLDNDCDGVVPADEVDADGDGARVCGGDCDDADATVFPGATELCDGVDNDCDPTTDENTDGDGDGQSACGGDCDDSDSTTYQGAAEICDGVDNDCNGVLPADEVDGDGDGSLQCADCDDTDPAVFPGAPEVCNFLDDDCDGSVDDGCWVQMTGVAFNTETNGYYKEQTLEGYVAANPCPTCDYSFDIQYTTVQETGSCVSCVAFPDVVVTLAYDSDYYYGQYQVVLLGYGPSWYFWYLAYPNQGGHDLEFVYAGKGYDQYGYWDFAAAPDVDGDGYDATVDCDDNDPAVNPGAPEDPTNGIDDNCNGQIDEVAMAAGDIVFTEVMVDPLAVNDNRGEWFELLNTSATDWDLDTCAITDAGGDSHTVTGPLPIAAGARLVLNRNGNPNVNGGVFTDYVYGNDLALESNGDELILNCAIEIDRIEWDGGPAWPNPAGATMTLDENFLSDNNTGAHWCVAVSPYGDGDLGTPGVVNDAC